MQFSSTLLALLATAVPAVWSLPTSIPAEPHGVPSCAADLCLQDEPVPGLFDSCNPSDLGCICGQQQDEVARFVDKVQTCIDNPAQGGKACTAGGRYEYKSLLAKVCQDTFGKNVTWANEG